MVSKFFSIILFLSSLSSFAIDTPFILEEDIVMKKVNYVYKILEDAVNTGKIFKDMTDEEKQFSKDHNINFERTIEFIGYALEVKDITNQKIIGQNVLTVRYFPQDIDWKSVTHQQHNFKLPYYEDKESSYEGYIAMVFQYLPEQVKEFPDDHNHSLHVKKDLVPKTDSSSKKSKKHNRKTSENLTFPEINSGKDDQKKSKNFEDQGEIKVDTTGTSAPKKNKKSSKYGCGINIFK